MCRAYILKFVFIFSQLYEGMNYWVDFEDKIADSVILITFSERTKIELLHNESGFAYESSSVQHSRRGLVDSH